MKPTQEQIQQKFDTLPEDLKQVLSSNETTGKILDIAEKYRIQIDEMGELLEETTLVILGFTHPNDFVSNIKKRLNISIDLAETLVREINAEVFLKIRESMKKIHEKQIEPIKETQPSAVATPPIEVKKEEHEFNREKILKEIEEPSTIVEHPNVDEVALKPSIESVVGFEKPTQENLNDIPSQERPVIHNTLEKPVTEDSLEIQAKPEITPSTNLVEKKLTESVRIPIEEKKVIADKPKLTVDPYREPIE